jgi:hypothetical protein
MTRAEYNTTRVIPERKKATRNSKRSIDAFIKNVRERIAIEHPEALSRFDNELSVRLMVLYFYFTKYITSRWNVDGMFCATLVADKNKITYTDNLLDDSKDFTWLRKIATEKLMNTARKD